LTESFIKDRIEGNEGKIIGYHVQSPLIWGIHISSKLKFKDTAGLDGSPFLVSRMGSGSHLMAFLLAKQFGWDPRRLNFEVVGDLSGAIKSMESQEPKIFLWEKYTSIPLVKEG